MNQGTTPSTLIADAQEMMPYSWQAQINRAFAEWSRYAPLTFDFVNDALQIGTQIGYPQGYPGPAQGNPLFGDIRISGNKSTATYDGGAYPPYLFTTIGGDININTSKAFTAEQFYGLCLHEIGHALGLDHSEDPSAAMYAGGGLARIKGLSRDDVLGIRAIYGSTDEPLPEPPVPDLKVTSFKLICNSVQTVRRHFSFAVRAMYGNGVPSSTYLGMIKFSGNGHGYPESYIFIEADAGAHKFNKIYFTSPGTKTITVQDVDHPQIKGSVTVEAVL